MIKEYIYLSLIVLSILVCLRIFKYPLQRWALSIAKKMKYSSIKTAIQKADKIQKETGKKTIVVFDKSTNTYDAVEKRLLKKIANKTKGKVGRTITHDRIKLIEKKSLYVAK